MKLLRSKIGRFLGAAIISSLSFSTAQAQYCTPINNCSAGDYIDYFTFGAITTSLTGCTSQSGGYEYFSNLNTNVLAGTSYPIAITPGNTGFPQGFRVWIDFNQDDDFDDIGESVYFSSPTTTTVFGTVNIPTNALPGQTRMRVRARYNNTPGITQSCGNGGFGETEDYNVTIINNTNPPTTNFGYYFTNACGGQVQFVDSTSNLPLTWNWNFGDGNTSTLQNPSHTYSAPGTYTVTLITSNSFGSDTLVQNNLVTYTNSINISAPSCTPQTVSAFAGFGILQFNFGSTQNNSGDATLGYENFACFADTFTQGVSYPISVFTNGASAHNVRVWADYNNNGVFSNGELIFSSDSTLIASGTVTIPQASITNTPLRLRVAADYWLYAAPSPCSNIQVGQAEDYAIVIIPNTNPPTADFTADETTTCNGVVNFTNLSTNIPLSYLWDFGDGTTSNLVNPTHTYQNDGVYTVKLIASNLYGSDTLELTNYVTVNYAGQVTAACTPTTLSYCCDYGISFFSLNTITNATGNASEGYQDFSCVQNTQLIEGYSYPVIVKNGQQNPEDVSIWIDYNNNGTFEASERVLNSLNASNHNGTISVPTGLTLNTPLRVRVKGGFVGSNLGACDNNSFSQTEDYSITIIQDTTPPTADFSVLNPFSCTGTVNFNNTSTGNVVSSFWDFGDGNTSTATSPSHTYTAEGKYTVKLITFGVNNTVDSLVRTNYIIYSPSFCNEISMATNGSDTTANCYGKLTDNGGSGGNYTNNNLSTHVISSPGSASISLVFEQFYYSNNDFITIYDGPNTNSPVLGTYTGAGLPNNGAAIQSSGSFITVAHSSNAFANSAGFIAYWYCEPPQVPIADFTIGDTVSCSGRVEFFDASQNFPTVYTWYFGDGNTSTVKNPVHVYTMPGTYDVELVATNSMGSDTVVKTSSVTILSTPCLPATGVGATQTACTGTIYDDGLNGTYSNNTNGTITIAPTGATSLELTVNAYTMQNGDFITIYDGPNTNSPILGTFSAGNLTVGQKLTCNSGAATINQVTNGFFVASGYEIAWECSTEPQAPVAFFTSDSTESCSGFIKFTDQSTKNPTSWFWDFGDGSTSTVQNPTHAYQNEGIYSVFLIVTNANGSDTLLKNGLINYSKEFCPVSVPSIEAITSNTIKIYPNPSSIGMITLESESNDYASQFRILDLNGKVVYQGVLNKTENQLQIPTVNWNKGVYILHYLNENQSNYSRFIIE